MAYYKYHNTVLPEIPKSNLPYVALSVLDTGNFVLFSSEPFVATKSGYNGYNSYFIYASVPSGATKEAYTYNGDKYQGWVKSTSYTSYVIIKDYSSFGVQLRDAWCNVDVAYESGEVVYTTTGDPVLHKESFPIKEFVTFLIAGLTNNPLSITETIDSIYVTEGGGIDE